MAKKKARRLTRAEIQRRGDAAAAAIDEKIASTVVVEVRVVERVERTYKVTVNRIANGPNNLEFVADSMTEHVETVVTKAQGDIRRTVEQAIEDKGLVGAMEALTQLEIGPGK